MNTLGLTKINELSQRPECCTQATPIGSLDFSRPFIHESFTQLYYTDIYSSLSHAQKLRYNQLFAIKINEKFMLFEKQYTNNIFRNLIKQNKIPPHSMLHQCLTTLIEEEDRHHETFQELNRKSLPNIYKDTDHYFTRLSLLEQFVLNTAMRFSSQLYFLLWFMISMEEFSVTLSRSLVHSVHTESLGDLEPHYVAVHKQHIKDEIRHVQIEKQLIRHFCNTSGKLKRKINIQLFFRFINDILVPKRSGIAVLDHWLQEFPELAHRKKLIFSSINGLRFNPEFIHSIYSRKMMPQSFALFEELFCIDSLNHILKGSHGHYR